MESRDEIELYKKIAERIKAIRQEKKLGLAEFHSDTGIHIGRIERGERFPTISTLDKICKYLGVSLSDFFKLIE